MGMFDTVIVVDELPGLSCPEGHVLRSFQTKDLDQPSMATYLLHGGSLFLAASDEKWSDYDEAIGWRIDGAQATREHRYELREVSAKRTVRVYAHCRECEPVLVRTEHATCLGDIVREHKLFVDFTLRFRPGEPVQFERTSGTRADLARDLRERAHVLNDNDPLAVAHREIKRTQAASDRKREWLFE
jgi:hypothetical protein